MFPEMPYTRHYVIPSVLQGEANSGEMLMEAAWLDFAQTQQQMPKANLSSV